MPTTTRGEVPLSFRPESMDEGASCAASVAFNPQVFCLQRRPSLKEAKSSRTRRRPAVDEPVPGKVVEVTVSTGQKESGGNGVRTRTLFATGVDEMYLVRAVGIVFYGEKPGIEFRQESTTDAPATNVGTDVPVLLSCSLKTRDSRLLP